MCNYCGIKLESCNLHKLSLVTTLNFVKSLQFSDSNSHEWVDSSKIITDSVVYSHPYTVILNQTDTFFFSKFNIILQKQFETNQPDPWPITVKLKGYYSFTFSESTGWNGGLVVGNPVNKLNLKTQDLLRGLFLSIPSCTWYTALILQVSSTSLRDRLKKNTCKGVWLKNISSRKVSAPTPSDLKKCQGPFFAMKITSLYPKEKACKLNFYRKNCGSFFKASLTRVK